jgi:hypothetical protein
MAVLDAFGDAALDADLATILGLGADQPAAKQSRNSAFVPDLTRHRHRAKLLISALPALGTIAAVCAAVVFVRPSPSSPPVTDVSVIAPAPRPVVRDAPSPAAAPAPMAAIDVEDVAPAPESDRQAVPPPETRRAIRSARAVRPAGRTAPVPRSTPVDRPVRAFAPQEVAVAPSPPRPSETGDRAPVTVPVAIAQDSRPGLPAPSEAKTPSERTRRDNITAIRSLRRQF